MSKNLAQAITNLANYPMNKCSDTRGKEIKVEIKNGAYHITIFKEGEPEHILFETIINNRSGHSPSIHCYKEFEFVYKFLLMEMIALDK